MTHRIYLKPGEKVEVDLTDAERRNLLEDLTCLDPELETALRNTSSGQPVKMTLDDLDQLSGWVAAEANHTKNKKLERTLDRIFDKIGRLLGTYTENEPPKSLKIENATKAKVRKAAVAKKTRQVTLLYQFKITLSDTKPPIWRRIQVEDCTLDKLHEHIQTAMGWTNSHLHQFNFDELRYADPRLMEDDFEEMGFEDSTETKLSDLIPEGCKPFGFEYEYDFGDSWHHKIAFEGCPTPEKGVKYPVCLEGERACPPEDVGGVGGYYEFLEALADPNHEEHNTFVQWIGGSFNAKAFDPKKATIRMTNGLPDWRTME
jgi:Plasmid pRiA4b ORF-3-like protein